MKYTTYIFDLDDTLAESKSAITSEMAEALCSLLKQAKVSIITGGLLEQITKQVVSHLPCSDNLHNLYLQPTSGSSLYTWDSESSSWQEKYSNDLPEGSFERVQEVFEKIKEDYAEILDIPTELHGPQLEDRGSQISFSALGQKAPSDLKKTWDPDRKKRLTVLDDIQKSLPDLEVRIGGTTTIDISQKGHDKAYGIEKFYKYTGENISGGLFTGDSIFPGGNDYAATKTSINTQKTSGPEETLRIIKNLCE